jgi:hypothetical protein
MPVVPFQTQCKVSVRRLAWSINRDQRRFKTSFAIIHDFTRPTFLHGVVPLTSAHGERGTNYFLWNGTETIMAKNKATKTDKAATANDAMLAESKASTKKADPRYNYREPLSK